MNISKNGGCGAFIALMFAGLFFVAILAILMGFPVMWLWNAVIPDLTKGTLSGLTFWQAVSLNLLCSILFKNSNVNWDKK